MKHRKWIMAAAAAVLLFSVFLTPARAFAAGGSPRVQAEGVEIAWPITLVGQGTWDGGSPWDITWWLYQDRHWQNNYGSSGPWTVSLGPLTIYMQYEVGCYPLYVGVHQGQGYFVGEMTCQDGSGGHGTWWAQFTPGAAAEGGSGGRDASSR